MGDVTARLDIDHLGDVGGGFFSRHSIDAGLDAHFVQHVDDIFAWKIADGSHGCRHYNSAAEAANCPFDRGGAAVERGNDVGGSHAGEVVDVPAEFRVCETLGRAGE